MSTAPGAANMGPRQERKGEKASEGVQNTPPETGHPGEGLF